MYSILQHCEQFSHSGTHVDVTFLEKKKRTTTHMISIFQILIFSFHFVAK